MILENPALALNIKVQDVLGIIEEILKSKNWGHFEVMDVKLTYTPFYIFNYDTLVEQKVEEQTFSQGFSGVMAINSITGKLEPLLTKILEEQPVTYEREISHDLQYEIEKPAIREKEINETCKIKLAGQFGVGKDSMAVSGFRLIYWPIWKIFVTLPDKVQKMEIDGVRGNPLNFEEVPEREKGWLEVTADTFAKLKKPEGWGELAKKTIAASTAGVKGATGKPTGEKSSKVSFWLLHSKVGVYTLILIAILILLVYYSVFT